MIRYTDPSEPIVNTGEVGAGGFINDFITQHLEVSGKIRQSQHGFTERKSCLNNLLEFFDVVGKKYL